MSHQNRIPRLVTASAAEADRRAQIDALCSQLEGVAGVTELRAAAIADPLMSVDRASRQLLGLVANAQGISQGSRSMTTVVDNRVASAADAILARLPAAYGAEARRDLGSNPMAGMSLVEIARSSLDAAGLKPRSTNSMDVVAAAFTQGTSDFPVILENVLHKVVQTAYSTAPDTWSRFCAIGSVNDFKAHSRYRLGSFSNLDEVGEHGEILNKAINDGEKSTILIGTKGNIINITRQAIINDDLGAFTGLGAQLGRAAKRSIEQDVYNLLALNGGLGPVLGIDNKTLFHIDHGNLAGAGGSMPVSGAPTMTTIEAARVTMALQKDVSGNDFLDMRPAVALSGLANGSAIRVAIEAAYDPDSTGKLMRPNIVKSLVRDVVDSPRIAGTPWYLFADPTVAPVIEVAFLNGNQEPYLEMQRGFDVDGVRYKVRIDYGVAGIDFKGAFRNPGS